MARTGVKVAAAVATAAAGVTAGVIAARRNLGNDDSAPGGERRAVRGVTINRPAAVVHQYIRDLPELARIMVGCGDMQAVDGHTFRGDGWTGRITAEEPERLIAWQVEGGPAPHEGEVRFAAAPGDRGTEVRVTLRYTQSGGALGAATAKLLGTEPDLLLRTNLRRVKQMIECGTIVAVQGQPTGRGPVQERLTRIVQDKLTLGGRP